MNEQQGCHHASRYPPRQCPGVQHHRNISPASPNWPPGCPCPTQASPKVPAGFGPPGLGGAWGQELRHPQGLDCLPTLSAPFPRAVSFLSEPPPPLLLPRDPNSHRLETGGWEAGGVRGGSKGATAPSSLAFLDKLRRPVGSDLPGLGPLRGLGGEERCHPSAQAPSHTPPGPRSIPAAPASLPRRTGLAEEPDGCGGGGEASRLPGPD